MMTRVQLKLPKCISSRHGFEHARDPRREWSVISRVANDEAPAVQLLDEGAGPGLNPKVFGGSTLAILSYLAS